MSLYRIINSSRKVLSSVKKQTEVDFLPRTALGLRKVGGGGRGKKDGFSMVSVTVFALNARIQFPPDICHGCRYKGRVRSGSSTDKLSSQF